MGLVSGGKDSCYAMIKCIEYGHEIVALANLLPADDSVDELDSYMYQTVGHQMVVGYAECMGVPLFRRRIQGSTRHKNLSYNMTPGDEVEDLFILLKEVKRQIPSIAAVSSGAIASDYQRLRVESVCSRLGLISLAYMWKQEQSVLLQDMIRKGIKAIAVKVAAMGLDPKKHLGNELSQLESYLHKLKELYGINVCGEGGEYETLTLDCSLFKNARLVLDKFDIILHSSDSIAPVGVLHPLAFHLESKLKTESLGHSDKSDNTTPENMGIVHEVLGDCLQERGGDYPSLGQNLELAEITGHEIHISKTRKDDTFSISCWLQDSCKTSKDLQDLSAVLTNIESQLIECGSSWENVLYVHLYIADMSEFAVANETYVRFITQEKCRFGVPSRSTIELPLLEVGLGRAYIEVLVSNDQSKRVLHVQSISCWAPSCIGPYSQATLHKEILYMAGQLGLDPPTMLLCDGGPTAELVQALHNSEAVAKCFRCSISTSAILFTIYCSASVPSLDRTNIEDKLEAFLKQVKSLNLQGGNKSEVFDPMVLYVLVPDLPKRASVEVKPILYVANDMKRNSDVVQDIINDAMQYYWGFQHEQWQNSYFQKCVVRGKVCAAVVSVTDELTMKIFSESTDGNRDNGTGANFLANRQMDRIARFSIFLIDKILLENNFYWDEVMNLRIYYPTALDLSHESLSLTFTAAFHEFSEMNPRFKIGEEPLFNIVPVLGAGRSATSMNDIVTCELFARKC